MRHQLNLKSILSNAKQHCTPSKTQTIIFRNFFEKIYKIKRLQQHLDLRFSDNTTHKTKNLHRIDSLQFNNCFRIMVFFEERK